MPPLLAPYIYRKRIEFVLPFLKGDILDLGCGYEGLVRFLSKEQRYTGIDHNSAIITRLKNQYPQHEFKVCDLDQGELSLNHSFDTIVMLALLEHLANPDRLIKNLASYLKPGGQIVLTTPTPMGNFIHAVGSRLGLFYLEASLDHKIIYNHNRLRTLFTNASMEIHYYRLFLAGGNQICVAARENTRQ